MSPEDQQTEENIVAQPPSKVDDRPHVEASEQSTVEPAEIISGDVSKPLKPAGRFELFKKKPVVLAITALLVIGGVAGVVFTRDDKAPASVNNQQTAHLGVVPSVIDGSASYKTSSEDWRQLTTATELKEGDWVSADSGARVVLAFDDGSALRLDSSTIIQLSSLAAHDVQINQTSGTAYSRVVASDRNFSVNVDGTSYTAIGTAFTTISTETNKGVQVLQSSVKASAVAETIVEGKQYFKAHSSQELVDKATDISLDELKSDAFMLWNLEQDSQNEQFKDKLGYLERIKDAVPEDGEEPASTNSIKLSARNNNKGTVLSWSVSGVDYSDGFKIVRSKKSGTPTFGRDEAQFVDSSSRSLTWKGDQHQKEYWYRVCAYRPDQKTCASYSNTVKIASVYLEPPKVTRGVMSLTESSGLLTWGYTGKAIYGYKVVISTSADPTYPENEYIYYGSKTTHVLDLSDRPDGTYHMRVCAYTNGSESSKCVDYSNDLIIVKP